MEILWRWLRTLEVKGIKDWEARYSAKFAAKGRCSFRNGYDGVREWS